LLTIIFTPTELKNAEIIFQEIFYTETNEA